MRRSLCTLFFGISLATAQENTVRVEFRDGTARTTEIGVFKKRGTLYASLTDCIQILSLNVYENRPARKLEIKHPPYRIKITSGNPYVVVTDIQNRKSVYQLIQPVINAADAYFVPLQSFVPYFGVLFNTSASYDAERATLTIGAPLSEKALDIPRIALEPKTNGMVIRIMANKRLTDMESWTRPDGWLYMTIADARADTAAINAIRPAGMVREIVAIQSPTSVQLTFRTTGRIAASEIIQDSTTTDVLLALREDKPAAIIPPSPAAKPEPRSEPVVEKPLPRDVHTPEGARARDIRTELESSRKRWELDVIVIDPGHGGRDPGTSSVTGVREKNVTLGIALKLGRLITKRLPGVEVVYTRKDDRFVHLDRRGQIANEAGGKLFISIHANSMARKPSSTRGYEVYLLRLGRTEQAIAIAERENAVITLEEGYEERYKSLTDENFILVAMAQTAYVKASESFADLAQRELAQTGLANHGVKQAGFYVLVGAAMPNVLIETGYLSNRSDEKFLKSESGQQKTAEAIAQAITHYKLEYEKLLREGAGQQERVDEESGK